MVNIQNRRGKIKAKLCLMLDERWPPGSGRGAVWLFEAKRVVSDYSDPYDRGQK